MKLKSLFLVLFSSFLLNLHAQSFEDYKKEFSKENFYDSNIEEFDQYKKQLYNEFELYKQTLVNEYKKYVNEISEYWETPETTTPKKWVEYSEDKKTKQIVDFENNEIIVEFQLSHKPNTNEIKKLIREKLQYMLTEDEKTAFRNDQVSFNTENKLKPKLVTGVSANLGDKKILEPIFFKNKATNRDISKKANELTDNGDYSIRKSPINKANIVSFKSKLPENALENKARIYKDTVTKFADAHRLRTDLIFSIIHNESSFNPMAKSYIPAYGLMQIVPKSAGMDATKFLYGKPKLLLPSYLYKADKNIEIGTVYLRILYYNYLKGIENPSSRLYCAIAAYNTGAGNVAKAFAGNTNISEAVNIINRMTPEDVYRHLRRNLPYTETKKYIKKVIEKMSYYKSF